MIEESASNRAVTANVAGNLIGRNSIGEKRADEKKVCSSYRISQRAESVSNWDQKFTNHGQAKRRARDRYS